MTLTGYTEINENKVKQQVNCFTILKELIAKRQKTTGNES